MTANISTSIEDLEKRINLLEKENQLLREREFAILRSLPEIVFLIDLNERFVFLNDTARQKFELKPETLDYNIHLKDILAPESIYNLRKTYLQESKGQSYHARQIKGKKQSGNEFLFTVYFSKLEDNGNLLGFLGIGFDITDRIDIENKLQEANLAKMKFLSIIAHDLRNPFNSILGFSNLLLANYDNYSDDKVKEYIRHMSNAANQGHQLLENLLDWARANMRKIDVHPAPHAVSQIVNDSASLLSGSISKKEIFLAIDVPENLTMFADSNMIRTVIRNLLSNAIKFTPRKGHIKISAFEKSRQIIIEVIDSGIGISPEQLPKIFSLSNDFSSLGTERERGTGLGLILCYEFIAINNGSIEAESIPGNGSTFRIYLPQFSMAN